jgi:hypothetical protein
MNREFEKRLKSIEQELTDLKTASEYSSVRSAASAYSELVYTGSYLITYDNHGEPIFSMVHTGLIEVQADLGRSMARTPQGGTQVVDIFTSYQDSGGQEVVKYTTMVVVSNVPVLSITRIS